MQPLPHHYHAAIDAAPGAGNLTVESSGLPDLATNAPTEYDGPGDQWSPETLLMAAVADCYVLSFRAIASASNLQWQNLRCDVDGTLDKADRIVRFTELRIRAHLQLPADGESRAGRILEKAKEICLVTNSLIADVDFQWETTVTA